LKELCRFKSIPMSRSINEAAVNLKITNKLYNIFHYVLLNFLAIRKFELAPIVVDHRPKSPELV
jgi:hypothetical protein